MFPCLPAGSIPVDYFLFRLENLSRIDQDKIQFIFKRVTPNGSNIETLYWERLVKLGKHLEVWVSREECKRVYEEERGIKVQW
jgi:hypothetical protein